jgi:prepilin-type N-terminal cleavage/methylation domain-containing protein
MMRSPNSDRRGVTLVELLIALAISGFALLGGIMLLDQVTDGDYRIERIAASQATTANGDRVLRRILADAHTTTDSLQRFRGDENSVAFLTLCDTPAGWAEECRATLLTDSLADSTAIIAEIDRDQRFDVRRFAGIAAFIYLDLGARDSAWVRRWERSVVMPNAIGVVAGSDTTILPLGSVRD